MCDTGKGRNGILCIIKSKSRYIDRCISQRVAFSHLITLASCCGHGRYPKSLVIRKGKKIIEHYSQIEIPRKKRFYFKDKDGYYYIPEILKREVKK